MPTPDHLPQKEPRRLKPPETAPADKTTAETELHRVLPYLTEAAWLTVTEAKRGIPAYSENNLATRLPAMAQRGLVVGRLRDGGPQKEWAKTAAPYVPERRRGDRRRPAPHVEGRVCAVQPLLLDSDYEIIHLKVKKGALIGGTDVRVIPA